MNWDQLTDDLGPFGLFVMGALTRDGETITLVGADQAMWPLFQSSPEYQDRVPDPLDTWSKRVLRPIATAHACRAVFPSDGPPYLPFIDWAKATGAFWPSPTGMLIHDKAGLMISIRGALIAPGMFDLPRASGRAPCETCADRPCETACPVRALSPTTAYDVPACKTHVASETGQDCLNAGCRVRRACPVSQSFGRDPEQSQFHMKSFMGM